jgi:hypothetical protein
MTKKNILISFNLLIVRGDESIIVDKVCCKVNLNRGNFTFFSEILFEFDKSDARDWFEFN